jgi:hypothetical protein
LSDKRGGSGLWPFMCFVMAAPPQYDLDQC